MNILTKISVVVLLVLVIFFSAAVITSAVVPANYKLQYEAEQQKAQLANQTAINSMLAQRRTQLALDDTKAQLSQAQEDATGQLATLRGEKAKLEAEKAGLSGQVSGFTASLLELDKQLKVAQDQRNAAVEAEKASRERESSAREELAKLNEAYRKTEDRARTAENETRALRMQVTDLQEQLADKDATLSDLKQRGVTASSDDEAAPVAAPEKIAAKVTAVDDRDGVSINVGSAKGITKNMVLTIYRGDRVVARMRVQEVDLAQSAGLIFDKQMQPRVGDLVKAASTSVSAK